MDGGCQLGATFSGHFWLFASTGLQRPSDRPPQSAPWTKFKADKAGVGVEMLRTGEDAGHEVSFASNHGASPKYSPKPRADWSTPSAHEDNFLNPPHS